MKQIGIIFGALLGFLVITIWVPVKTTGEAGGLH